MTKASKPSAKRATRATRSRKASTSKKPKRTAKAGQEKQSISSQRQQREKEGAGAETGAGVSNIPASQSSRKKVAINLADECDFRKLEPAQAEACCLYEYFRESAAMREALKSISLKKIPTIVTLRPKLVKLNTFSGGEWTEKTKILTNKDDEFQVVGANERMMPLKGYRDEDVHDYVRLRSALTKARFPVPWNRLAPNQRKRLAIPLYSPNGKQFFGTGVLAWHLKDRKKHPALLVKEFSPGHDPVETDRLLKQWKQEAYYDAPVNRPYFFGLFRLDESYNESEAVKAFAAWFEERHAQTKGGGAPNWGARLNHLVVMRLRNRFPGKRNLIKRVQRVAELTTAGFAGCKAFWDDWQNAKKEKREVEQRMSKAANEEMSRARADALKFFQTLFRGEKPLSY